MLKVCIAGNYPAGTVEAFRAALPEEKFEIITAETQEEFTAVTDADAVVLRVLKMPAPADFARFTNLKMVMRWGVGYDNVDIQEAGRLGVSVCNTPGANAYAVAELAVGLMINAGRNIMGYYHHVKAGDWDRSAFPVNLSLNHKTVGLLGGGNIGRQVAAKVQAFGARVQYYDPFRMPEERERELNMTYVPLETLVETSDIISLHVPLLDSTRHIIDAAAIGKMKTGAIVINTARGGLIDDQALAEAVHTGKLAGAGLDGVENEPLPIGDALLEEPNIIVTPHVGGGTADLGDIIIPMLVRDILDFDGGKEPAHVVNKKFLTA